jgi:surface antigen
VCCALAAAGCSFKLNPMSSRNDADVEQTGSVGSARAAEPGSPTEQTTRIAVQPSEADLVYAREAAAGALGRGGKDVSVPWENPNSGAGGNITPLANSYTEGGFACRDFLASYVHGGAQDWLEGAACRTVHGTWEVKRLKPLKRA